MNILKALIARFRKMRRSDSHDRHQVAPPSGRGPSINLTPEQFHQLMIAALEESPRAREIVRQAFLPAFPIQGGTGTTNYIAKFVDDSGNTGNSLMYQSGSFIGFNTTSPEFGIDLNSNVFAVGTKTALSGAGGTMRFRDDTGTVRWLFGIPGEAGSQDFQMYNLTNGHAPFFIQNGAPSYSFYFKADGTVGIGTNAPAYKLDVNGNALAVGPKTGSSGNGGAVRFRDDTAAEHWLLGLPSSGGGTLFRITDLANSHDVVTVESGTPASTLALKSTGDVGIGTTSPAAKLDVAGGINASGSIVIGGTATKQTSGGPEKISAQDSDATKVVLANFVSSQQYTRLLIDMQGNHEWAGPSDVDQNVLLGWLNLGRLQCQGLGEGGFSLHAWKHSTLKNTITSSQTTFDVVDGSQLPATPPNFTLRCEYELMTVTNRSGNTLTVATRTSGVGHGQGAYITATGKDEAHSRIELNFDGSYGTELAFSDGTNSPDTWLSRPVANQIYLRGNLATQRADITLANTGNDNIGLGGASFVKATGPSTGFTVTGFTGGSDGRILRLYNATSNTMTIGNAKTSDPANQILTLTGSDLPLRAGGQSCATFIYDSGQSKWILVGTN